MPVLRFCEISLSIITTPMIFALCLRATLTVGLLLATCFASFQHIQCDTITRNIKMSPLRRIVVLIAALLALMDSLPPLDPSY
ncbi:hypothetical protein DE146DRAFT_647072 [Phaeosphaeria sp. MPI-PUGE-AT-0046c]|nr:hypothetical protein DE146DRAFT_647072 [Phaeosphaeria sp. MPI-PUGE-AT-0046c]